MKNEIKLLEIRDRGTTMPVMVIQLGDDPIIRRGGWGPGSLLVMSLDPLKVQGDPFAWEGPGRTMHQAHLAIEAGWGDLRSGDVVDVQFYLGETQQKKTAEIRR